MKNFQAQVEKLHVGDRITVTDQRNYGKDEYKEIEFEVTVGARLERCRALFFGKNQN